MYHIVFLHSPFKWHIGCSQFPVSGYTEQWLPNKIEKDTLGNLRSSEKRGLKRFVLRFLRSRVSTIALDSYFTANKSHSGLSASSEWFRKLVFSVFSVDLRWISTVKGWNSGGIPQQATGGQIFLATRTTLKILRETNSVSKKAHQEYCYSYKRWPFIWKARLCCCQIKDREPNISLEIKIVVVEMKKSAEELGDRVTIVFRFIPKR